MKENNLVITGMGAVTPVGIGVTAYWNALIGRTVAVWARSRALMQCEMPVQIAAELKDFDPADLHAQDARAHDGPVHAVRLYRRGAAGNRESSGLSHREPSPTAIGIVMGTAMDGV